MSIVTSYNVRDNDKVTFSAPEGERKTCKTGVVFQESLFKATLTIAVIVIIAVGVITYTLTVKTNPLCTKNSTAERWDNCKQEASNRQLCIVKCAAIKSTMKPLTKMSTIAPHPSDIRLPTDLYPVHYRVTLHPRFDGDDENKFNFSGTVIIKLRCVKATNVIVLHTLNLTYDNTTVTLVEINGGPITITHFTFDTTRDLVKFHSERNLESSKEYTFTVEFSGPLKRDLEGLYLSSYTRGNKRVYLVTTQLEPVSARKIFPCFDEPAFKSVFQVRLVRTSNMTTLSNMEIIEKRFLHDDFWIDTYSNSPKMSVYLFAVTVCDFVNSTAYTKTGIKVSVWTRPEFASQAVYARDLATKILTYYEEFFQISYPLPKIDMLGVPDFGPGAMENWGLIIYRETNLLHDSKLSQPSQKERIAVVVAHELAHMWFGNLVTMSWWDDLWLNEGFASYVEFLGVDHAEPEWKLFESFRKSTESAMNLDSLKSSHPLYVPVSHPAEINEIFDRISYEKGSHVIKMMRFFMGKDKFDEGLSSYLKKHAYGNAKHSDLWKALSISSNMDVERIMATWVLQMNFPLVHIRRHSSGDKVVISQERYLRSKNDADATKYTSPFGYRWIIPMTILSQFSNRSTDIMWLNETDPKHSFSIPYTLQKDEWILGNPDNNVFCRVNYDQFNWNLLIQQLKTNHTKILPVDRITLIHDACKLARSLHINTTTCLDILSYIDSEDNYPVLYAAFSNIAYINSMLHQSRLYGKFSTWVKSKAEVLYDKLMANETLTAAELPKFDLIVGQACQYGYAKCLQNMNDKFKGINTTLPAKKSPPYIRRIYCYGVKQGTVADWNTLYSRLEEVSVIEKKYMIDALGCTDEVWLLNTYLNNGLRKMRTQDLPAVVAAVSRSSVGRSLAYNFFRQNWHEIVQRFGSGVFSFSRIISAITSSMNTPLELQELKALLAANPDHGTGANAFQAALDRIEANIQWMELNEPLISYWLDKHIIYENL